MPIKPSEQGIRTLEIVKTEEIAASIDIVFETLLEQIGPYNETPDGSPLVMHLEAWPGGRWFRDLGNNTGHFWGTVQAIKPPALLEICGPLFMSFPAMSNVQYRLSEAEGLTRVQFVHRALGQIPEDLLDGVAINKGWGSILAKVRENAERKSDALRGSR
ncbi:MULTISPECIES: SRPBCC domain-containing protein [Acidobacteriaceae]|uniref:SRPBCC family protein n=1 Tax=Acidobacteriaceae TaxID=204434 RepID=UPI00131C1CA4|nr:MULTISPECIES: SRPBCC domain-containing protein [Acidobacteriaceae]MDW5264127.1 SRPBCC domain-containing protein [Edaphobacter sp.]